MREISGVCLSPTEGLNDKTNEDGEEDHIRHDADSEEEDCIFMYW